MTTFDTPPAPTTPTATRPDPWWRVFLVAAGVILLIGGPQHPDAPAELPLREELATMLDDDAWVPSHVVLLVGVVVFALGLWRVQRVGAWPARAHQALRVAVVAFVLYAVESVVHLMAFVDVDRLRDGEVAPVAFTHLGLALVLYPVSGLALAWLAWRLMPTWSLPQRVFAVAGVVGGTVHAISVPATFLFPDAEVSPLFAFAGTTIAIWSLAAGLVGIRASRRSADGQAAFVESRQASSSSNPSKV